MDFIVSTKADQSTAASRFSKMGTNKLFKIAKYVLFDILRNRFVLAYTLLLLALSMSFFNLEGDPIKSLMSLLNIVLIVLPMVSIIFTTIHSYNSYEFVELLLAQPMRRSTILAGLYIGVAGSLSTAFLAGVGIPVLLFGFGRQGLTLLLVGLLLTLVFVSMAFLVTVLSRDKAKGIGMALITWFYFSILYDGLILLGMFAFSDYPLEKPVLIASFLNPVDLGRIAMLMQLDAAALMGYTGAMFQQFFGSTLGHFVSLVVMSLWVILPIYFANRVFNRNDI
jgi:Cu-processing system permease protein